MNLTINEYTAEEQLRILKRICHIIYIARNISMSQETILEQLAEIDILFRENENFN